MRDTVTELRRDMAELRAVADRTQSVTVAAIAEARADLDRFDRLLGSAEAISGVVGRNGNRVTRVAMSAPMIKAAGIATGTSRAVKRLRSGT